MGDRPYLSIGEVLTLLRDEFPDVTISKIRFLESQGLLDPERTPSGYRKFYEPDIERLRWILQQQRENFLPLKVIKGRLREPGSDHQDAGDQAAASSTPTPSPAAAPPATATATAAATSTPRPSVQVALADAEPAATALSTGETGVTMTFEELCAATELTADRVRELEKFGLVSGREVAGTVYYDEDAFVVARLAAGFHRYGVEARHLRIYKNAADREAGFFEQVVMPLMKQRNPSARRQAVETLGEMAKLGQGLRAAMLRQALKDYTSA
jgi:DNA-binding transcriptional MerR regulator